MAPKPPPLGGGRRLRGAAALGAEMGGSIHLVRSAIKWSELRNMMSESMTRQIETSPYLASPLVTGREERAHAVHGPLVLIAVVAVKGGLT